VGHESVQFRHVTGMRALEADYHDTDLADFVFQNCGIGTERLVGGKYVAID
jgi:hypothetical protein